VPAIAYMDEVPISIKNDQIMDAIKDCLSQKNDKPT